MAFCTNCGEALPQGANFCPSCQAPVSGAAASTRPAPETVQATIIDSDERIGSYGISKQDSNLRLAAFVINVITCVAICWAIIPLAWTIPMTVHSYKLYKGEKANTIAFGVCTLLFLDVISGVLLLISNKEEPRG